MKKVLKLYTDTRDMILAAPSDCLGDAVKGLFRVLSEPEYRGEDLSLAAMLLFLQLRKGTDESIRDYQFAVACGKRGSAARWKNAGQSGGSEEHTESKNVWEDAEPGYFPVWEGMSPSLRRAHRQLNDFQRALDTAAQATPGSDGPQQEIPADLCTSY